MPSTTLPRLKMCKNDNCSDIAVSYDKCCVRHSRASRQVRCYTSRPMPTPSMKNPFGMELECVNTAPNNPLGTVTRFACSDASLDCDGVEIKIVADVKKIGDKAADIAQRARIAGGKVTRKCGFHVHMSRPIEYTTLGGRSCYAEINSSTAQTAFAFIKGMEDQFFQMIPNHRRDNQYCRKLYSYESLYEHYSWVSISDGFPLLK